ncbi:MAG: hypothetical protein IJI12_07290 [Atopobiaceae bacterium]|nr:hypothetical protein [Atopobiaceae bacterium]
MARQRSSNFELMRIVLMLLIVGHHLLSNTSLHDLISLQDGTLSTKLILLFSMWGKTAINPFVMVSGYFMCTSRLTARRVAKLYAQIKFYRLGIFAVLAALGYQAVTREELFNATFNIARFAGNGFVASFMVFYLFIPFYNLLIGALDERKHRMLVALLLFWQTGTPLLFGNTTLFNEVIWYATLYFVGAYIRLYPSAHTDDARLSTVALVVSVALSMASVLFFQARGAATGQPWYYAYRLVSDSNQILALLTGVAAFLFFKNLRVPQSKLINTVASATFGVLLIHASSPAMNTFLWERLLNVSSLAGMAPIPLLVRMVAYTVVVFAVCAAIDLVRIRLLEKPFMSLVDRFIPKGN